MTQSQSTFSAADSALGYLYQVRVALLWSLRRTRTEGEFVVSLETLDDVTFEYQASSDNPQELLQTKHHLKNEASLSDASCDLWKSLRVWFEGHANSKIPYGTALYLITTGTAPTGSAARYLRSDANRNVEKALQILETVTQTSNNQANVPAYQAFTALSSEEKRAILDNVVVFDRASNILKIDDDLKKEIYWSAEPQHLDAFLRRLEGWWLRRVIKQLTGASQSTGILSREIEAEMAELREQFKQDNLPIDDDLIQFTLDDETYRAHEDYQFVYQLKMIDAGKRRVAAAIRDYYRAFEQRSRWLREHLLYIGELSRYEQKLVEEWELVFEAAKDEVGATATEEMKREAARSILAWAERSVIPIRPGVTEPFVVRGSFHMLADEKPPRIGWHPEFLDRLSNILSPNGSVPRKVVSGAEAE